MYISEGGHCWLDVEPWLVDDDRSITFIALYGLNNSVANMRSDLTYEILDGCGLFEIDGTTIFVQSGESVEIPAGTQYQEDGVLTMLVTAIPPFNEFDVVVLSRQIPQ